MNFEGYLTLYSGGADSTLLLLENPSAVNLIHYKGLNDYRTRLAASNAYKLQRRIQIASLPSVPAMDGEVSAFQSVTNSAMILDAGIHALRSGLRGLVLGFNKDDDGVDQEAIRKILAKDRADFEVVSPFRNTLAAEIRQRLSNYNDIVYSSCMIDRECGHCAKCIRGY